MSFTVIINGVTVQCETAADAISLTREAAAAGMDSSSKTQRHSAGAAAVPGSRWTEARIKEFFKLIKTPQRKLVETLLESADPRNVDQLCATLNIKNGVALAGTFTGLWKNAKKVGADPKDMYQRQSATIGDRRQYEYSLTEPFRAAALKWKP